MSHDNPHQPESCDQVAGDKTRDTVPVRPQGSLDDASDKETDAATENTDISNRNTPQRSSTSKQSAVRRAHRRGLDLMETNPCPLRTRARMKDNPPQMTLYKANLALIRLTHK